jgi:hypothetical protein
LLLQLLALLCLGLFLLGLVFRHAQRLRP